MYQLKRLPAKDQPDSPLFHLFFPANSLHTADGFYLNLGLEIFV